MSREGCGHGVDIQEKYLYQWCLIIHEVILVIVNVAIQGLVTKLSWNAEMHIGVEFRVESNGVVHHPELGLKDHGEIVGVQDP